MSTDHPVSKRRELPEVDYEAALAAMLLIGATSVILAIAVSVGVHHNRSDIGPVRGLRTWLALCVALLPLVNWFYQRLARLQMRVSLMSATQVMGVLLSLTNIAILAIAILSKQEAHGLRMLVWDTLLDLIDLRHPFFQFVTAVISAVAGVIQAIRGQLPLDD